MTAQLNGQRKLGNGAAMAGPPALTPSSAAALLDDLLAVYKSDAFRSKLAALNASWDNLPLPHKDKKLDVDDLCNAATSQVWGKYGFSADESGAAAGKVAIQQLMKGNKELAPLNTAIVKCIYEHLPNLHSSEEQVGSTQQQLMVAGLLAQLKKYHRGYHQVVEAEQRLAEEKAKESTQVQEEDSFLDGWSTTLNIQSTEGSWRCLATPKMFVRTEMSMESAPHQLWLAGLRYGEEVAGTAANGWLSLSKGGYALIVHPEKGRLLRRVGKLPEFIEKRRTLRTDRLKQLRSTLKSTLIACGIDPQVLLTEKASPGSQKISSCLKQVMEQIEQVGGEVWLNKWLEAVAERCVSTSSEEPPKLDPESGLPIDKGTSKSEGSGAPTEPLAEGDAALKPVKFWGICDVKYDPRLPADEQIRVLELGDGRASRFSNHGQAIKDVFAKKYCMDPDPLRRAVLVENKKLTHDMFAKAGYTHLRPPTRTYPRSYTSTLAQQIIHDLGLHKPGSAVVLKLCNRSRGAGVVVVEPDCLDAMLRKLLLPPLGDSLEQWLASRREKALSSSGKFASKYLEEASPDGEDAGHWWSNECPVFVAEKCCHSKPVAAAVKDEGVGEDDDVSDSEQNIPLRNFDGTLRVAFALCRQEAEEDSSDTPTDARQPKENSESVLFDVEWLGGYWKLPRLPCAEDDRANGREEDIHDRIVSSFNSAEKRTAAVPLEELDQVYEALTPALQNVFKAGSLGIDKLLAMYSEPADAPFRAFVVTRHAASIRGKETPKAKTLRDMHARRALPSGQNGQKSLPEGIPERCVLSYIERNAGVDFAAVAAKGSWENAFPLWKRSLEAWPLNATSHYLHGCYFQETDEHPFALRHAEGVKSMLNSILLDPDFRLSYQGLGNTFMLAGDFHQAVNASVACLRRFPDAQGSLYNLGQAYYHLFAKGDLKLPQDMGRFEVAEQALRFARTRLGQNWTREDEKFLVYFCSPANIRVALQRRPVKILKLFGWRP